MSEVSISPDKESPDFVWDFGSEVEHRIKTETDRELNAIDELFNQTTCKYGNREPIIITKKLNLAQLLIVASEKGIPANVTVRNQASEILVYRTLKNAKNNQHSNSAGNKFAEVVFDQTIGRNMTILYPTGCQPVEGYVVSDEVVKCVNETLGMRPHPLIKVKHGNLGGSSQELRLHKTGLSADGVSTVMVFYENVEVFGERTTAVARAAFLPTWIVEKLSVI